MVQPGSTILFHHHEARGQAKDRPALVLAAIGGSVLIVVGQTDQPDSASVLVSERTAGLKHATYFDCGCVLAMPVERVMKRIGRVSPRTFHAVERACAEALEVQREQIQQSIADQRARIGAAVRHFAESTQRLYPDAIDVVADQARIARQRLREILDDGTWTGVELRAIASVLGVEASELVDTTHE